MNIQNITTPTDIKLQAQFEAIFENLIKNKKPSFLTVLERHDLIEDCRNCFKNFKDMDLVIVLGIGGSSLGAKVLTQVFQAQTKIVFFENVDAFSFHESISKFPTKSHFIVVSKSGSTLETLTQVSFLVQILGKAFYSKCTVITEKKSSALYDWASEHKMPILEIPMNLGGRFSVLSPVGMYPALFMGVAIENVLSGALQIKNAQSACSEFCAQVVQSFERRELITVFWSYSDLLKEFGFWVQQLWSESLGKSLDLENKPAPFSSTPLPLVGTNDQHSVLQQIIEGQKDKFVVFLRNLKSENHGPILSQKEFSLLSYLEGKKLGEVLFAQYNGTQKALEQSGVNSMTIVLEDLSPESIGYLFLFFEMVVAMLGDYHNINTFNQPGVELSKKIATNLLKSEP